MNCKLLIFTFIVFLCCVSCVSAASNDTVDDIVYLYRAKTFCAQTQHVFVPFFSTVSADIEGGYPPTC